MAGDRWALHNLADDRCEMVDLSRDRRARLAEMVALWQACEDRYRTVAMHPG